MRHAAAPRDWIVGPQMLSSTRMGASSPIGVVDRLLAAALQTKLARVAVRLELWDGSTSYLGDRPPVGDLVVRDRGTVLGLLLHPDLSFGETYMASRLFVRG